MKTKELTEAAKK